MPALTPEGLEAELRLAGIVEDSIVDGPGLRLAVFVQGCPHGCPGCHNPEAQPFEGGWTIRSGEVLARLTANPLLDGLSLSGGEPFWQAAALAPLAAAARARGYHVMAWTGCTLEALLRAGRPDWEALLRALDVLVDGPFIQARRSLALAWRGSDNQRVLDVPRSLALRRAAPAEELLRSA